MVLDPRGHPKITWTVEGEGVIQMTILLHKPYLLKNDQGGGRWVKNTQI